MNQDTDPLIEIKGWLTLAKDAGIPDYNSMALATSSPVGLPNVRVVLLKEIDATGLIFFTNYQSIKGKEIQSNMRAAISIHWRTLKRQIRVRGDIEILEEEKADAYFDSRPLGSRYSAWASKQSQPLQSRQQFENEIEEVSIRYGENPPRPDFWGGYRILPREIEFWKQINFRRHDRFLWTKNELEAEWNIQRLYP